MNKVCFILSLFVLSLLNSCENDSLMNTTSDITVVKLGSYGKDGNFSGDEIVFTGNDILWFDTKTREIRFTETASVLKQSLSGKLLFKTSERDLFIVDVIQSDPGIRCNDMVLLCNKTGGRFFLYDSYPNGSTSEVVKLNAEIRSENWALFLFQLRREGRIK